MHIAIICTGIWPLPATKGGAVANLIESIMRVNEIEKKIELSVFCAYDHEASVKSKEFKYTNCVYYHIPFICKLLDNVLYLIVKRTTNKRNLQTYRNLISRMYMLLLYILKFDINKYDKIILLSNPSLFLLLKFTKFSRVSDKTIFYAHNEIRSLCHCEKEVKNLGGLLCVSQFVSNSIKKTYPAFGNCKSIVLKNCIDANLFFDVSEDKILAFKTKIGITKDDYVILFAGRLTEEKGTMEVIQAVKGLPESIPYKLLIVGSSFFSSDVVNPYILDLIKESEQIKNRIITTGFVKYEDMPVVYKAAHVAVLPSIWEEPAGLTMLEAAIAGIPLITTKSGGIHEYIPKDVAIFLERDSSLISNITNSIQKLYFDIELRRSLVKEGVKLGNIYNLNNFYINFVEVMKHF